MANTCTALCTVVSAAADLQAAQSAIGGVQREDVGEDAAHIGGGVEMEG